MEAIRERLERAGVEWVRILWCDHANLIRGKAAHVSLLADGLPEGVGIAMAQQALPVMYDAVAKDSGLGPVGEARLVPDWDTLKLLPYAPGQAQVIGDMRVGGRAWEHCPREYLRQQIAALAELGLCAKAAFENEFFLLWPEGEGYRPADRSVFAATGAMNRHQDFIHELTRALLAQDLQPEFYYPESGPGQQELSIRYSDALQAADHQIVYRETVRGVAVRHGLVASFLPKIFEDAAGSGCHLNLSLWEGENNALGDPAHPTGLSPTGRHFLAGVLAHLPGLTALTIPTPNSFRRIRPHFWAGAFRAWGYDNREAALRVSRGSAGITRFELKASDASANPYLALGALLAAGMDGLRRELPLPPEATVDPGLLSSEERERMGFDPLPTSLGQALDALREDTVLLGSLGPARARAYLAVKQMEWEALKELTLEEEVRLLAERY